MGNGASTVWSRAPPGVGEFQLPGKDYSYISDVSGMDVFSPVGLLLRGSPESLGGLRRVTLCGHGLKSLPDGLATMPFLEYADLSDNELSAMPNAIAELKALRVLRWDRNGLLEVNPRIGELLDLTRLTLSGNLLVGLPPEVGRLVKLQELDLEYNPNLLYLPRKMGRMTNLEELFMTECPSLIEPPAYLVELGAAVVVDFLRRQEVLADAGSSTLRSVCRGVGDRKLRRRWLKALVAASKRTGRLDEAVSLGGILGRYAFNGERC